MSASSLSAVRTISEMVRTAARRHPDSPAIRYPDFAWTFAELEREADRTARGLIALGVRPGDHVAVLVPNGADFMRAFFGVALAGGVAVTLNTRYRKSDLQYVLSHCDAKALVVSRQLKDHFDTEALLQALFEDNPELRPEHVIVLGCDEAPDFLSARDLDAAAEQETPDACRQAAAKRSPQDTAAMLYTSGTTAFPKGCLLSHHALTGSTEEWGVRGVGLGPGTSIWIPNPLFHIGALTSLLASVGAGAQFMSQPYFEPDAAVSLLIEHPVDVFFPVFDAIALPILEHPRAAEIPWSQVRYSFVTGNPANVNLVKRAIPGARHLNTYGMTETSGWCCLNFDEDDGSGPAPGGIPLPGVEVRVVDLEGRDEVEINVLGRIQIRSYCTITGYYKDAEATRRAFPGDGWFDSGDLGVRKEDGSIRFQQRMGDLIRVGGENVSPVEVEAYLSQHPAIRCVAVVGVVDTRLGSVVAAFVELYPGTSCTADELTEMCRRDLAAFKVPRHFRFVTEAQWPMSATKIRKVDLRDALNAELTRA